jgi:hypothetical protein
MALFLDGRGLFDLRTVEAKNLNERLRFKLKVTSFADEGRIVIEKQRIVSRRHARIAHCKKEFHPVMSKYYKNRER